MKLLNYVGAFAVTFAVTLAVGYLLKWAGANETLLVTGDLLTALTVGVVLFTYIDSHDRPAT